MKDITVNEIIEWEHEHGECFIYQNEHEFNGVSVSCFMIGRNPILSEPFWEVLNENKFDMSVQNTLELYEEHEGYSNNQEDPNYYRTKFYEDFLACINTTSVSKQRVIDILNE